MKWLKNLPVERSCVFLALICQEMSSMFMVVTRQSPQRQAAFRIGGVLALHFGQPPWTELCLHLQA